MNPGLLDDVLAAFAHTLSLGWTGLTPDVLWLLSALSTIYLLTCLPFVMAGMLDLLPLVFFSVAKVTAFAWAIANLKMLTEGAVNVTVGVGLAIGGAGAALLGVPPLTVAEFMSPGRVLFQAQNILQPLMVYVDSLSWLNYGIHFFSIQMMVVAMYLSWIAFFICAAHIVLLVVAFQLLAVFALVQLPWGIFSGTSWIAKETLSRLIGLALRLGATAAVTGVIVPILNTLAFPVGSDPTYWSAFGMLTAAGLLVMLSVFAPHLASLHGGALVGMAAGGVFGLMRGAGWSRQMVR
jgi:type IV secretion system protein TrbL